MRCSQSCEIASLHTRCSHVRFRLRERINERICRVSRDCPNRIEARKTPVCNTVHNLTSLRKSTASKHLPFKLESLERSVHVQHLRQRESTVRLNWIPT